MYNHGRNIWRFTYLFQHNEFHAWSAANHAKVITGTQITAASRVKMNVSADLPRRLPPESMAQLCHVVADVKLKKQKKKEREKRKKKEKRAKKEWKAIQIYIYVRPRIHSKFRFFPILEIYLYFALENWFSSKKKNPCNSNVNFNQSLRIKLIGITIFNRYRELFILRSSNSNDRLYLIFLGLELESFVAPKTENDRNWKAKGINTHRLPRLSEDNDTRAEQFNTILHRCTTSCSTRFVQSAPRSCHSGPSIPP